jgi:hypothetical protein
VVSARTRLCHEYAVVAPTLQAAHFCPFERVMSGVSQPGYWLADVTDPGFEYEAPSISATEPLGAFTSQTVAPNETWESVGIGKSPDTVTLPVGRAALAT